MYSYPHEIPSFPTRRSSDLVKFWDVDDIETLTSYKGKIRALRAVVTKPEEEEDPATWCFALIGQRTRQLSRPTADRKSTRLNSSHTVISYAVFCLKKKRHTN